MKKILVYTISILFIVFLLTFMYVYKKNQAIIDYVNTSFGDIKNDLQVWVSSSDRSESTKKDFSRVVISKLIRIVALKPDVSKFNGEALEVVCLLNKPEYYEVFENYSNKEISKAALFYLQSISKQTNEKLKVLQASLGGSDCSPVKLGSE